MTSKVNVKWAEGMNPKQFNTKYAIFNQQLDKNL